eukprot:3143421-Rhodomonas_salina.1
MSEGRGSSAWAWSGRDFGLGAFIAKRVQFGAVRHHKVRALLPLPLLVVHAQLQRRVPARAALSITTYRCNGSLSITRMSVTRPQSRSSS